ncbi:MAG: IclR family mhp operon transcriptional activator [Halieaceae bacterium]|jgi:IclR family mhp operon transcriptional activator
MTKVRISKTTIKALAILEKLNEFGEASNAAVAEGLKIPRATTYRLLETLRVAGMVEKDVDTHTYRPAERALALSCGFEQEAWISAAAKPQIDELGAQLLWPIAIATLAGTSMLLRETTDRDSPLVVRRYLRGRRVDIRSTATGRVYLAHCIPEQREALLQMLRLRGSSSAQHPSLSSTKILERRLHEIRQVGFDTSKAHVSPIAWCAMAVPVFSGKQVIASLSVRYADRAVSKAKQRDEILPALFRTAELISASFHSRSTSETA